MTEDQLRTLLREETLAGEPAFLLTSDGPRARGRRTRARRRTAGGMAAAAVLTGAALLAPGLLPSADGPERPGPVAPSETAAPAYPETMPPAINAALAAATAGQPDFATRSIQAHDWQGNVITGADRDKADSWAGAWTWSPTHQLDLGLWHAEEQPETAATQQSCAEEMATFWFRCDARELDDGTLVVHRVGAVKHDFGQYFQPLTHGRLGDPDERWFEHTVETTRGSRMVIVVERVKAPSYAAALDELRLDDAAIEGFALAEGLEFPEPPRDPETGCRWIVPEKRDEYPGLDCNGNRELDYQHLQTEPELPSLLEE